MQKNITQLTLFFLCLGFHCISHAQKGIPPPEQTTATTNTNYAQPKDFKPSLLHRLHVPNGYIVKPVAVGLGKPRYMALNTDGSMYVTRRDAGDVLYLKDLNDDGKYDQLITVIANFRDVHGITIHDGWLYLCSDTKLTRGRINADGSIQPLDTLINNLPVGGQHDNRTIAFGPDGLLYVSVGSDCNDCRETNPEHATLLQMNADGTNRRIFARNLRNTIGFDWDPQTGELWGLDHGSDTKGDTIPHEELNHIKDQGDYGWPLVYDRQQPDYTREDPVGDTKENYARFTEPAVMLFPAHSAPMDFVFLGSQFPNGWQNDALASWHGSWNRKRPEGFKVQRIKFNNGQPTGVADFLSGFYNENDNTQFGRPVDILLAPNGDVYVSDDSGGVIYCVTRNTTQRNKSLYSKK